MIRRLLVLAAVGLALVLGTRLALAELTERAWALRRQKLAELALVRPSARRPWEVRFEALVERVRTSPRLREIQDSPYRPHPALGTDEPRRLDEFERLWIETLWDELAGLDAVLAALRSLPAEDREWNGDTQRLTLVREWTNALCARAWLALESGDHAAAAGAYADALRLARATDDGSCMGTLIRAAAERIVLGALRGALAFGASPTVLRAELVPLLEGLAFDPERVARAIRTDLAEIPAAEARGAPYDDPAWMLARYAPVEEWLALAREPARAREAGFVRGEGDDPAAGWDAVARCLRELHGRRNVALTALALAAHRSAHGRFPATLAEVADLPPAHALDPGADAPLAYWTDGVRARVGPAAGAPSGPGAAREAWTLR